MVDDMLHYSPKFVFWQVKTCSASLTTMDDRYNKGVIAVSIFILPNFP